MGRGEPGDEKERELKAPECAIAAGRWEGRQTRSSVRFNEERNKQHENRPIYIKLTNICTTSSLADPQMRRNLNARVPPAQGAFVRDGPRGNSAGVSK